MSVATVNYGSQLIVEECYRCGVSFAMPHTLRETCLKDHSKSFYCPNGHGQVFSGKTEAQKLREELERTRDRAANLVAQRDQAQASARAQRGVATRARNERDRLKKRVANGVCPCCNRSFSNLTRHMQGQHPEYAIPEEAVD